MTMTDSTLVVEHRWRVLQLLLQGDFHGVLLSRPSSGTMCRYLRRHQDFLFPWKWRKATLRKYSRRSLTSQWTSCKGNILISTPVLENYIKELFQLGMKKSRFEWWWLWWGTCWRLIFYPTGVPRVEGWYSTPQACHCPFRTWFSS